MISRSTASGWALCVIGLAGLFGVWRLYMIARPKMLELELDGDEKLRSEMWKDIDALKRSRSDVAARLTIAETQIANQTVRIGQQEFVLKLVISELERVSPGNLIAKQARILLDQVQPAAFPTKDEIAASIGDNLAAQLAGVQ